MSEVDDIVRRIATRFSTFGGGRDSETESPIRALRDFPAMFALGVDVREVVEFVLSFRQGSRDQSTSPDAVDPSATDSGTPSTRV